MQVSFYYVTEAENPIHVLVPGTEPSFAFDVPALRSGVGGVTVRLPQETDLKVGGEYFVAPLLELSGTAQLNANVSLTYYTSPDGLDNVVIIMDSTLGHTILLSR